MNFFKKVNNALGGKIFLLLLFVAIFLSVAVFGIGQPGDSGIQVSHYYSNTGKEGITQNISFNDSDGDIDMFTVENGLIVNFSEIESYTFNLSGPGLMEGLIAYWKLDDLSGNAIDSTGHGLDLTNNAAIQGETGIIGDAYHFNGDNSYLTISDSPILNPSQGITVAAWIYKNSTDDMTIIDKSADQAQSYMLRDYGGNIQWNINSGGTGGGLLTDSLPVGQWSFVVGTYNGTEGIQQFYLNGQNVATNSRSGTITPSDVPLTIGTENQGFATMNGLIDEVGIWDRALSSSEIEQLYNSSSGETYPFN